MASPRRNSLRPICHLWLVLWAWLLIIMPSGAQPIILHLQNGDRISGVMLTEDPARVILTNAILGRLSIPLASIARREGFTNAVPTRGLATAITNSPASIPPPGVQSKLNDLQTAHAMGSISTEEHQRQRSKLLVPPKPPGPRHWSTEVFAGLDLLFSEKDRQLYTGRAKLNYTRAPLRNNIDYLFTYGWTDGELTANRMDGSMKTDLDLTPHTYLYSIGGAGYDEIRHIDWRYEVGPGVGYHLVKRSNFVARVEAGFHYQVQNFQGTSEDKSFYQRLAQDVRWNIGSQFTFDEKVEYFPQLTDLHIYRLRAEANLRYWLKNNLSLNFTIIDTFDTQTAPGVIKNDLQLRSSIGVKF